MGRAQKNLKKAEAERLPTTLDFGRSRKTAADVPALPVPAPEIAAQAPAAVAENDVRPRFDNDREYALWLHAHPGRITPSDAGYLLGLVAGRTAFRTRLEMEGVDVAAFELVLKSSRSQAVSA